jgi:hypothetical protein
MLISVLPGPVHVCNYIRITCLFAFTVILILFTVTTLWMCPISFGNDFYDEIQFLDSYNSTIKDTGVTDIISGGNGEVCYGTTQAATTMTTIISQSWGCYLHYPKY